MMRGKKTVKIAQKTLKIEKIAKNRGHDFPEGQIGNKSYQKIQH